MRAYFEEIPAGENVEPVRATASLGGDVRMVLEDRVELPRLHLGWHSPAMFADGDAETDLLADLLANGKTSRLYRTLVYERRIALDVSAYQHSREISSFFLLAATAAPGQSLTEIAAIIDERIQHLADEGPVDEEIERGLAQAEAHFMYRLQTVGGFGGKSDQLNAYNVFRGDPDFFSGDLDRYRAASRQSLRAATRNYLAFDRRVLLSIVPRGQAALALPGSEPVVVS